MPTILTEAQLVAALGGGQPGQIAMTDLLHTVFAAANYDDQPTPTGQTGDVTLTIAKLLTRVITFTTAISAEVTLPTGTNSEAGVLGGALPINRSFDWSVINLGSVDGVVTIEANTGHTLVGSPTVPISTSGLFRTRKTALNTFVTYRIS